ncbi:hypothetical protein JTE90_026979 [Oedothorax gibbosus]|uniref:Uncharacterized protein n=1 Tax=Oedothorax gibbosus TaxID=931172 RepID=A0AAV6U3U7_9ARAC|nr:hypothetical protein JTE90_026979 [Oedothorax gibbosus]
MEVNLGKLTILFIGLLFLLSNVSGNREKRDEEMSEIDKILEDPDHPDHIAAAWNATDHSFSKTVEQVMKKLMPMVIRSSSSVDLSGPCMAALFKMMLGIRQGKLWASRSK